MRRGLKKDPPPQTTPQPVSSSNTTTEDIAKRADTTDLTILNAAHFDPTRTYEDSTTNIFC